jgi:hypothetical protein
MSRLIGRSRPLPDIADHVAQPETIDPGRVRQLLGEAFRILRVYGRGRSPGAGVAAIMLVVVFASNHLLENFVEPKVMGRTLDIHPLVVLVVTRRPSAVSVKSGQRDLHRPGSVRRSRGGP